MERAAALGIEPRREVAPQDRGVEETAFREEMLRRAWDVVRAQGWARSDEATAETSFSPLE